jgi:hypothetical protein
MKHPSPRLIVASLTLALLGGSAAAASAAVTDTTSDSTSNKTHVICVINQDPGPNSPQHGLCLVVSDPKVPTLP